jgi:glycosyltransferase involved in cell wall biosynthesis
MRVCHVTDSADPGGAETVILLLLADLARRGVEQEIILLNEGWLAREARLRGWFPTVLPSRGTFDVRWVSRCAALLRARRIDLVHLHLLDAGFYGSLAALRAGLPAVATEHGDVAMAAKSGARHTLKLAVTQSVARRVVAVSEGTRQALLRRLHFGGSKTVVIYNGIGMEPYSCLPDRSESRAAFGIPPQVPVIGTLGALTRVKGHDVLLRAHAQLAEDVWCVIAGDGPCREALCTLTRDLGTADRVAFPGFVRDPARVLSAIDVFCLSSASEGLPLVLIEAIAARRPVVATAVGGVPEVIAMAGGGRLVPAANPTALAAGLRDALDGTVTTPDVPRAFRCEVMGESYFRLYHELLGR